MKPLIIFLIFTAISLPSISNEIVERWHNLDNSYLISIENKEYEEALEIAFELDAMEPSNSQVLLYIIYAHIKLKRELPDWVKNAQWPSANSQDKLNRLIADQLMSNN